MTEMTAAAAAMAFGAQHAVAAVFGVLDGAGLRIVEARPAGAALEFLLGDEQRLIAAGTGESTGPLFEVKRAAARPLRAVLAHDVKLLRREQFLPLGFGVGDGIDLGVHDFLLFHPPLEREGRER